MAVEKCVKRLLVYVFLTHPATGGLAGLCKQGRCRRPCGPALCRGHGSTVSFPAQFCGLQQGGSQCMLLPFRECGECQPEGGG